MALLETAPELGCAEACFELGRILISGPFGVLDEERGLAFLRGALELRHQDALIELSMCQHERLDFDREWKYYRAAVELKDETARHM
jgi:TPR repeat protein